MGMEKLFNLNLKSVTSRTVIWTYLNLQPVLALKQYADWLVYFEKLVLLH